MKLKKALLYGLSAVATVTTLSVIASSMMAEENTTATIEVSYLEESAAPFVSYKAVLKAPKGTVLKTDGDYVNPTKKEELEFVLSHHMTSTYPQGIEIEHPGDSGVVSQYYGPYTTALSWFISIEDSTYAPRYPIESYIDLPAPGVHELSEGETFVLGKIGDRAYDFTVVDIAD